MIGKQSIQYVSKLTDLNALNQLNGLTDLNELNNLNGLNQSYLLVFSDYESDTRRSRIS